jgi:NitT/TauT family transport system substrate-binding protein
MNPAIITLIVAIIFGGFFAGCVQSEPEKSEEKISVKVGILPIEDALPFVVADEEKIFEKYGLDVEVVQFQSAIERDSAFTSGQVDAVLTDPLAVILLRNGGHKIQIVSICLGKTPEEGVFTILAAPDSSISSVKDLEGKTIAISSNTIIEYITDIMLEKYGVKAEKVEIKSIPLRMQTLLDNKVDAATLPEPLASLAELKGAKKIMSDADLEDSISHTVIVFNENFVKEKKDVVKNFLKAYDEAVERINSNPDRYREKFIQIARVPEPLANSYKMPVYPKTERFPEEYYSMYLEWAMQKGLLKGEIPYSEAVAEMDG